MSNLKQLRINAGMTQAELAKASGVNLRILQSYEQGFRNLEHAYIDAVLRLCVALKCDADMLFEKDTEAYRACVDYKKMQRSE